MHETIQVPSLRIQEEVLYIKVIIFDLDVHFLFPPFASNYTKRWSPKQRLIDFHSRMDFAKKREDVKKGKREGWYLSSFSSKAALLFLKSGPR